MILNRVIAALLALTILLSSVDFGLKTSYVSGLSAKTEILLMSETRNIQLIQLASNARSLIDVANGMEFTLYEGENL